MTSALESIGAWVRGLTGWRRVVFALATGAFSALGFIPFEFFPALLVGFALLVLLLDGAANRTRPVLQSALVGWCFAFGQFVAGMYWVGYAFFVDAAKHLWMLPIGIAGLPAVLALFIAPGTAAAGWFWRPGWLRILILALVYGTAEWMRGHFLTGFPWNLPAYGWAALPAILQSTALFGAYGLTFLTVLFGASFAVLTEERGRQWWLPASISALFGVLLAAGLLREALVPTTYVPAVSLRIVQPNIPQAEKYEPQYILRNWRRLLALSTAPGPKPTVVIWPESAPPFLLEREPQAIDEIDDLTRNGTDLITGDVRSGTGPDRDRRYYNSLTLFGRAGSVAGIYDKFHLVPFGEYVPFEPLMSALGITKLVGIGSFGTGDGPHTFQLDGLPSVGPLICYEIIFPGKVTDRSNRPQWLVNVSDDSWFGPGAGPEQHLLIARVRAIEEGLAIVRGTNTGISAVIDPLGRVTARLGLNRTGALDAALPESLFLTPYGRFGDLWFAAILLCVAAVVSFRARRNRRPAL